MFRYCVYGLHIASESEFSELVEDKEASNCDIEIVCGEIPVLAEEKTNVGKIAYNNGLAIFSRNFFYLRIDEVAEYYIESVRITIRPVKDTSDYEVKAYLYGSAIGICAYMQKNILIHGSGLSKDNKGVIITGNRGSGKSTTAARLRNNGYLFIADDVCGISADRDKSWIEYGYPQIKLCRDAAIKQGFIIDELTYIDENRDKFLAKLTNGLLVDGQRATVLFEIVPDNIETLKIIKMTGQDKLNTVIRNIFRSEYCLKIWGISPDFMKKIIKVANDVLVYRILRPIGKDTLDLVVEEIERIVGNIRCD